VFGLRPLATNVESPVLHKNIGKHFVAVGAWAVVHSIAGGEKHPFVVVGRPDELAFLVILCLGRFFVRRGGQRRKASNQNKDRTQLVFIDHMTLENTPLTLVRIANT